jgi:hypothetical protein
MPHPRRAYGAPQFFNGKKLEPDVFNGKKLEPDGSKQQARGLSSRLSCKPNNWELRCEAAMEKAHRNALTRGESVCFEA